MTWEQGLGAYVIPLAAIIVGMTAGALDGWLVRKPKPILACSILFLGLPALVSLPLLVASDSPWRIFGPAIAMAGAVGFGWLGCKLSRRWGLTWGDLILGGAPVYAVHLALATFLCLIATCSAFGFFRDGDWMFVFMVQAIGVSAAAYVLAAFGGAASAALRSTI